MRDEPLEATDTPVAANPLVSQPFRDAMRRFATTVSIITCAHGGSRFGMSATAVTSLSVDPPSLLVCVNKSAATHRVMSRGGKFCVNVLRSVHAGLSQAFSGKLKGEERFQIGSWGQTEDGLPFLDDAQANVFCEIVRVVDYETHTIFIASVYSAKTQQNVDPLIYQDGKYAIAQPLADDQAEKLTTTWASVA
jgi:flavin reductase (DIM6/NTAB) family NADH-FMN oxidoreductase RutF